MHSVEIPEDILREILEISAYTSFAQAALLAQVSHVVHTWYVHWLGVALSPLTVF
ncbi:hypothetical protein BDN72DRAFT_845124 [Pluteus cervinus]|uniref:Uncharacterized protein n=1 Tax=Pluteus cervinus TaxID=181527 RepID=A0ACD3AJ94_9AGAR|nr:hypothetical protein BDN72DRAFT_845124 [Pluteus cervinus]